MPHRELLTESQRLSLHAPASDERGMVRHYTLSSEDLALINRRRGDPNRLGFALMLCYLHFPGRILQQGEQPPAALCAFVAEQLGLDAAQFGDYAERDQTRREHVLEIETALGLRPLSRVLYRELAAWLLPTALATDHGPTLVATLLEELRARRIVCPSLPAIERLAGSVRARAQRQLWRRLADGLTDQQRHSLDRRHAALEPVTERLRGGIPILGNDTDGAAEFAPKAKRCPTSCSPTSLRSAGST
jgi:hypothetical protein